MLGDTWRIRYSSQLAKKNVLSFLIGPPREPPNWFWIRGARTLPARLKKKFFAFRSLLRRNSYAEPWKTLLPDLMLKFTTAPAVRPYSAENFLVCTRNSSVAP